MSIDKSTGWQKGDVSIPVKLGEKVLCRFNFQGLLNTPDFFSQNPIQQLTPPINQMKEHNVCIAKSSSCPVDVDIRKIEFNGKYIAFIDFLFKHYFVKTTGEFESYLATKKKKTISTLKRKIKKLEATNKEQPSFERFTSPSDFETFFNLAIPVSEKSYQQRLFGEGLSDTEDFKNKVVEKSKIGKVIGYVLRVNDKPAAYTLCPLYDGNKALYGHTGYDPDVSKLSPGTVLQYRIIEDLFAIESIDYYDLCLGEGAHKELFATGFITCANIFYCTLVPNLIVPVFLKLSFKYISNFIKDILGFFGLKKIVKKFIRSAA